MNQQKAIVTNKTNSSTVKRRTFLSGVGLTLAHPFSNALAQGSRPIRMIVPLPAGTATDNSVRIIAEHMTKTLGQPIVVDNKPGANGVPATMELVRAAPDGMTIMCGAVSQLATNVALVKNLPYDPMRALTPIGGAIQTNHVLVVKADSPIRSFSDFIAYAKQRPGAVNVGSSTTVVNLQIASMNKLAGIDLMPIPYKGTPATITDVIGGVLDATLSDPGSAMAQVKAGKLRALAVTSAKRNPTTPDWPAISETLPGFDFTVWTAFVGPAGMSRALVERISAAVIQAQKQLRVGEQLALQGMTPLILRPDELKAYMDAEAKKYVRLAREANIQPE